LPDADRRMQLLGKKNNGERIEMKEEKSKIIVEIPKVKVTVFNQKGEKVIEKWLK
jgi:hypothetical protein